MKPRQEQAIDDYLRTKGLDPQSNPGEAAGQGDRLINGARTEYKTISQVKNPTELSLSGAISNRAMNARSQAPNVVIDARKQIGMTELIARRGIIRAYGADTRKGSLDGELPRLLTIRVILKDSSGDDIDVFIPRS